MFHVTLQARTQLHEMLMDLLARVTEQIPEDVSFRIVSGIEEQSQMGLTLDLPRANDTVVKHEGRAVLLIGLQTSELLDGQTLDALETPDGSGLHLRE